MAHFTFIDLFAGIGGFRIGLQSAGGTCIGFSEIAPDAINTYCANFNETESDNFGDITKLKELPPHDFMTAGVPCQSWSIAGKNLGFDDDRGQLWNDTLFLLNKVRPKAFIFENVKGLADPRNKEALDYIMSRVALAGYHAKKFILNAYDYGVPQTRVRIYIIGFRDEKYLRLFKLPAPTPGAIRLNDVLDSEVKMVCEDGCDTKPRWSLSCNEKGFNDYFLFNDLRNGSTTIHSWDIINTTDREKSICYLLLANRRKNDYGELDGNPLALYHFQNLDPTIRLDELETLVEKKILKHVDYLFEINDDRKTNKNESFILALNTNRLLNIDQLKTNKEIKKRRIDVHEVMEELVRRNVVRCIETRYDFKNTKISTGLGGVNRIFLPSSKIYPTLVASDTNDFISTEIIDSDSIEGFREEFMERVYRPRNYRRITKAEACRIQGFPDNFVLPPTRPRWMKLIGNSVAVPVIKKLAQAVVETGVFDEAMSQESIDEKKNTAYRYKQLNLYDLFKQYPGNIVDNSISEPHNYFHKRKQDIDENRNVLICLVKDDNVEQFLNQTAKIYYTGKQFPTSVALNKLYYFIPYIKRKGIRDLYLIRIARVGTRKEGQPDNDPNDFRLVFEIEFVKNLFNDYKTIDLEIWHTYIDTTINKLQKKMN